MFHVPLAQAPSRLLAATACVNRTVVPPLWTMETRKKSALEAFEPSARYHDSARFGGPVAGQGDRR